MNSSNIFNIRKKKTLVTLMSFLPKRKRLELIKENKRLQKALKVNEVLYRIYSMRKNDPPIDYDLKDFSEDEYTKREILKSLFETNNLPFFNYIGFDLCSKIETINTKNSLINRKLCHDRIINNIVNLPPMEEGQILIGSYSWDNSFKIWDIGTKKLINDLKLPTDDIICGVVPLYTVDDCKNRHKNALIMVLTWDKVVLTYDLKTNTIYQKKIIDLYGKIMYMINMDVGDKKYVLTSSYEKEIIIWDLESLKSKSEFNEEDDLVGGGGESGISEGGEGEERVSKSLKLKYKDPPPEKVRVLKGHGGPIPKILKYGDKRIISCSWDQTVRIWNLEKFICEDKIDNIGDKIINMYLLNDNLTLAVIINSGYTNLINLKTKEAFFQFEASNFIYQLNDHRIITGLHEVELQIINLATKKIELIYKTSHSSQISGLLQLTDGRLITCSFDQTIKVHGFVSQKEKSDDAEDFIYSYGNDCLYITYNPVNGNIFK